MFGLCAIELYRTVDNHFVKKEMFWTRYVGKESTRNVYVLGGSFCLGFDQGCLKTLISVDKRYDFSPVQSYYISDFSSA